MQLHTDTNESLTHPLDNVEDVLSSHHWTFNRMSADELIVHVAGKSGNYRLFFIWDESMSALQFCCQFDITIPDANHTKAARTLMKLNEDTWMGHFDLPKKTGAPNFRYTALCHNKDPQTQTAQMEEIIDIALTQCERAFPAFTMLSSANDIDESNLSLMLMETRGES